jgi:hypothetical protein
MRRLDSSTALLALVLFASASCGSSLGDPNQPDPGPTLPEWADADCMMFNPTACRLDVAKTSVGIDVHYPNTYFCRLQILPTSQLLNAQMFAQLASSWQVTMGYGATDQTVITPEMPRDGVLEYDLGTEQLYLTRVTFSSKSSDTLAIHVANATGRSDVFLFAVPLDCTVDR